METTIKDAWTAPYYGISHLGKLSDLRRASVTDYGDSAELTNWWRGCGFSPEHAWFDSVDAAKAAGEQWIAKGGAA